MSTALFQISWRKTILKCYKDCKFEPPEMRWLDVTLTESSVWYFEKLLRVLCWLSKGKSKNYGWFISSELTLYFPLSFYHTWTLVAPASGKGTITFIWNSWSSVDSVVRSIMAWTWTDLKHELTQSQSSVGPLKQCFSNATFPEPTITENKDWVLISRISYIFIKKAVFSPNIFLLNGIN